MVINIAELPFKCPVAPLEFAFMADWLFTINGVRDHIEIELATPLPGAFTKPVAAEMLGKLCEEKNVKVTPNFQLSQVNADKKELFRFAEQPEPIRKVLKLMPDRTGHAFRA